MVQVPTTPQRSVQVQPLEPGRLRYAESRNYVGEAVQDFGNTMRQSAETFDAIEAAYDQAEVVDRDNGYATDIAATVTEFSSLKGDTPAVQMQERLAALDQKRTTLLDGARSERSRNLMKRNLDVRYENTRFAMQRHADAEMFKFRDAGLESSVEIAKKDAVRGYGTEQFELGLATAKLRLQERAKLNGWAPEQLADETAQLDASVRYDAVVALATDGEPTAALKQAEEWEANFAPEQYSRLNNLLRPRVEAKMAAELVPGIIEEAAAAVPQPKAGAGGSAAPVGNAKSVAQQIYPGIQITSHTRKAGAAGKAGANSWHVKSGAAIDSAPISGMTFQQYVQGYKDKGYSIIEAVDETDPATMKRTGATGPHWHVVLGEKGSVGGEASALDPRMDPEFAEAAARKFATEKGMSESQTDALISAARDRSGELMQRRNVIEREEERQFDEAIVAKGIDMDNVTSESQLPAGAWDGLSPSSQAQKRQMFSRNRERIAKEREEAVQAEQLQRAILAGGSVDYADKDTKKAADALYAQKLSASGGMDAQQLMRFNVQFATQIGFVPPALRGQLRGQLRNVDPSMQIAAAATLAEIGARNPAILNDFSDAEVTRAEQLNYYRRRGFSAKDAVERVGEMERLTKSDQEERKSQFTALSKQTDKAESALEDAFGTTASPALVGEFKGLWQQEFVRTGDIELARSTALAALRRTWGVSRVNGREQVMKNPPELHYGRLDRGEADAEWIRDQAFKELYGSGVSNPGAQERFELKPWNRTVDGQPVYIGTLQQPDGTIVTAVDERGRPKLYRPDFGSSAAAKRIRRERGDNVQRARDKRSGKREPLANPGFKL